MSSEQSLARQDLRLTPVGKQDVTVRASNVSKCYHLFDRPHDRLKQAIFPHFHRLLRMPVRTYSREFWALRNISFEVNKGETVGIIGRNGSGKSTLLQIIAGTLSPTEGQVHLNGRVAALLELGSGFNPEFTGKENVYINAAIQGLSKSEIDGKFEDIVAFSEIGDFMEQPLKTFSSGMYVRLAFAVAVSVVPNILIVDEALAVGDMAFQAKCMGRIRRMMESGTTVLFVSHDIGAVKALCRRCLYLEAGCMVSYGDTADVTGLYIRRSHLEINAAINDETPKKGTFVENADTNKRMLSPAHREPTSADITVRTDNPVSFGSAASRYGDGGARILDVKLLDNFRRLTDQVEVGQQFIIQVSARFEKDFPTFAIGYSIRDLKGQMLVGAITTCEDIQMPAVRVGDVYVLDFVSNNKLRAGVYTISVGLEFPIRPNEQHLFLDVVENVCVFRSNFPSDRATWFPTMVRVPTEITCIKIPSHSSL